MAVGPESIDSGGSLGAPVLVPVVDAAAAPLGTGFLRIWFSLLALSPLVLGVAGHAGG